MRRGSLRMELWTLLVLGTLALASGCGRPPVVQFDHLPLISSLRTACSAKNTAWLEGVQRAAKERHVAGKMTDEEHAHFEKLIAQAKAGEWESAERGCLKFEQAQLSRKRPAAEEHSHSHSHD